jgi:hypothetical protein
MPKRKRRDRPTTARASEPTEAVSAGAAPVDPQVALFAQRHQEDLDRQKAEQRAAAERRKRDAQHQDLIKAKDDAVARVKALRRRDRVASGETAEADAAYKAALAALIEFETGAAPPWATTDEPPPDAEAEPQGEDDVGEGEPDPEP